MSLIPYTITAIERDVADANASGRQIIVGAVCSMTDSNGGAVILFDDALGSNGSTAKATGANGQVTVYLEAGQYALSVNGTVSNITIGESKTKVVNTFSEFVNLNTSEGDVFTCIERANAQYVAQANGATQLAGDALDKDGRVLRLQINNFVSPENFGADSTGTLGAWSAITDTHTRANLENVDVIADGVYLVDATDKVIVRTNSDYSKAKFIIQDSVNIAELVKIEASSSITITPPATNFNKGVTVLPDVQSYPHSLIAIESADTFLLRNGTTPVVKKDVVYHSENGYLSHPLYFDMSTITNVIIKKVEDFELVFRAPTIEYADCSLTYFIRSDRNQVVVYGGNVINNQSLASPSIGNYFSPTACMDNKLVGKFGDALSTWDSGQSSYDYSGSSVLRPYVSGVISPHSWAAVDGNCYRDLIVENSISSRFGCHSMLFGATIRNCTVTEKAIQVTGAGKLIIENVDKTCSTTAAGSLSVLVDLREDYGGEWDGEIYIDKFSVDYTNVTLTDQDGAIVRLPFNGDVDYGKQIEYPTVRIKNGNIAMSSSASTVDTYNIVEFFRYTEEQLFTRIMPSLIELKNIKADVPTGSNFKILNPIRVANIDSANISGTINVKVDNVGYDFDKSTLPIPQTGASIKVNATAAEKASPSYSVKYTFKNCDIDAIFQAPSNWSLSCVNSNIYNFDNFFNSQQGEGYTEARNCNIWSGRYSGNAPKAFYSCTLKVDGVTDTANINAGVVRFSEGVIESGFSLTGKTNAEWVNGFYDGTYFEPV